MLKLFTKKKKNVKTCQACLDSWHISWMHKLNVLISCFVLHFPYLDASSDER